MATAQEITSEIARLRDRLRIARNGLKDLNPNLQSNQAILARYRDEVANIPGQILALEAELKSVLSPASAGDIVGNANQARDNNANATRPIVTAEVLTPAGRIEPDGAGSSTNANPTPTTENTPTDGTDPPVKTISQTQAINNQQASIRAINNAIAATGGPGAGAPPDDARGGNNPSASTTNAVRNRIDELYGGAGNGIVSQDNILDQYASYTYSLSWYLMNPKTYNQTIKSTKKDLNGFYLLVQSGGAEETESWNLRKD